MATHCDTMDGPLMKAARRALESGNVNLVLHWVSKEGDATVRKGNAGTLSRFDCGCEEER